MSSAMNNTISMIMITLGVALCAAFGARLPDQSAARQAGLIHTDEATKTAAQATTPQRPTERLSGWWSLAGLPFSAGCVLIVAGALLARREEYLSHQEERAEGGEGPVDLGALLEGVHQEVVTLHQRCTELQNPKSDEAIALRDALKELLRGDLERVIEARGKVKARYGVASFAELYGAISQGERRMNRAWSALVDQHIPEASISLEGAVASLAEAAERLKSFS